MQMKMVRRPCEKISTIQMKVGSETWKQMCQVSDKSWKDGDGDVPENLSQKLMAATFIAARTQGVTSNDEVVKIRDELRSSGNF